MQVKIRLRPPNVDREGPPPRKWPPRLAPELGGVGAWCLIGSSGRSAWPAGRADAPSPAPPVYSGLVLRSPMTRSPGFHCPRFFSNSTRSKRLSTFRLAPEALAALKLGCCDINQKKPSTAILAYCSETQTKKLLTCLPGVCQWFNSHFCGFPR